jgi:hypothetical protein
MSQPTVQDELRNAQAEPWLPIESKLVGWSLGIGIVLLVALAVVNALFPVSL